MFSEGSRLPQPLPSPTATDSAPMGETVGGWGGGAASFLGAAAVGLCAPRLRPLGCAEGHDGDDRGCLQSVRRSCTAIQQARWWSRLACEDSGQG